MSSLWWLSNHCKNIFSANLVFVWRKLLTRKSPHICRRRTYLCIRKLCISWAKSRATFYYPDLQTKNKANKQYIHIMILLISYQCSLMKNREFLLILCTIFHMKYNENIRQTYKIGKRINTLYTYPMEQLEEVKLQCYKQPD